MTRTIREEKGWGRGKIVVECGQDREEERLGWKREREDRKGRERVKGGAWGKP